MAKSPRRKLQIGPIKRASTSGLFGGDMERLGLGMPELDPLERLKAVLAKTSPKGQVTGFASGIEVEEAIEHWLKGQPRDVQTQVRRFLRQQEIANRQQTELTKAFSESVKRKGGTKTQAGLLDVDSGFDSREAEIRRAMQEFNLREDDVAKMTQDHVDDLMKTRRSPAVARAMADEISEQYKEQRKRDAKGLGGPSPTEGSVQTPDDLMFDVRRPESKAAREAALGRGLTDRELAQKLRANNAFVIKSHGQEFQFSPTKAGKWRITRNRLVNVGKGKFSLEPSSWTQGSVEQFIKALPWGKADKDKVEAVKNHIRSKLLSPNPKGRPATGPQFGFEIKNSTLLGGKDPLKKNLGFATLDEKTKAKKKAGVDKKIPGRPVRRAMTNKVIKTFHEAPHTDGTMRTFLHHPAVNDLKGNRTYFRTDGSLTPAGMKKYKDLFFVSVMDPARLAQSKAFHKKQKAKAIADVDKVEVVTMQDEPKTRKASMREINKAAELAKTPPSPLPIEHPLRRTGPEKEVRRARHMLKTEPRKVLNRPEVRSFIQKALRRGGPMALIALALLTGGGMMFAGSQNEAA